MEKDCLSRHRRILACLLMGMTSFLLKSLTVVSLNDEGIALLRFKDRIENDPFGALLTWKEGSLEDDPCSWFGVDCVEGHVVSLDLKNLCLSGTLAPELGHLVHIKLIILRNNSLSGVIPDELRGLKELEVLDLDFNNFSGPLPREWGNNLSVLLLDNNGQSCQVHPEVEQLMLISEVDLSPTREDSVYNVKFKAACVAEHAMALSHALMRRDHPTKYPLHHRQLQESSETRARDVPISPPLEPGKRSSSPPSGGVQIQPPAVDEPATSPPSQSASPPPSPPPPSLTGSASSQAASDLPPPPPSKQVEAPPSSSTPFAFSPTTSTSASGKSQKLVIPVVASIGGFIVVALGVGIFIWRRMQIATVGPRSSGMNGQLQRSLVNGEDKIQIISHDITEAEPIEGIPNVKRWELEAACEEFSNVIGFSSLGAQYKGTLSSGAEIAVLSYPFKYSEVWSKDMQTQFRKKIEKLSKVNHKNFLNLVAYCQEEEPFTRMLVFEYAPSGTLFEHLHVRESEHLDWTMRLRIMMGITYSLEYIHTLTPCVAHENLTTYAVNLTEDYAAKISDFGIWNEVALAARPLPVNIHSTESSEIRPEDNVYSFGLILLEMMTGKNPYLVGAGSLDEWVLGFLRGEKPLKDLVDPMLRHFDLAQLERIGEVIRSCTYPNLHDRARMVDVASRLREITVIDADGAAPRNCMWWPAFEFQSSRSQNQASKNT